MKQLIVFFILLSMIFVTPVLAKTMTLPNGTTLNIDNLSDQEIMQAVKVAKKSIGMEDAVNKTKNAMDFVAGINPDELDKWRKLITGTIKDICDDLSIGVNEFVKTRVGLGVAALIIYKVAGKDLLNDALDIVIMIPLWCFLTGVSLFFTWYFYSMKTLYEKEYDKDGKIKCKTPQRIPRYMWESKTDCKIGLAWGIFIVWFLFTVVTLLIVLV